MNKTDKNLNYDCIDNRLTVSYKKIILQPLSDDGDD